MTLDPRWYARLFDRLGAAYLDLEFTQGTEQEVAFLEEEMQLIPGWRVLDVGCGAGRHSVELAERGYEMTGIDLSGRLLSIALNEARRRDLVVNFINQDARRMEFANKFHAAICLYGGGFGIVEDEDEDAFLLSKVRDALEPGAVFALGAENRLHLEARPDEFPGFNPETGYHLERQTMKMEGGRTEEVTTLARIFREEELRGMLEGAGFRVRAVYGAAVGEFGRNDVSDSFRGLLAIAEAV